MALGGDDGIASERGHKWRKNPRHINSPTVYNAVFYQKQFWDGRSPDLEDQAIKPIQSESGMTLNKENLYPIFTVTIT